MIDESTCNYLKFSDSNLNDMHPKQPPYLESLPLNSNKSSREILKSF